jgi:hypothetical protein
LIHQIRDKRESRATLGNIDSIRIGSVITEMTPGKQRSNKLTMGTNSNERFASIRKPKIVDPMKPLPNQEENIIFLDLNTFIQRSGSNKHKNDMEPRDSFNDAKLSLKVNLKSYFK